MRLTKRQEYILDDWLGCGDSQESEITGKLIEKIKFSSTAEIYRSQELKDYYNFHKDNDCWYDLLNDTHPTYDECYHWVLAILVDLIDYSEYECDTYDDIPNRNVYDRDSDLMLIKDMYDILDWEAYYEKSYGGGGGIELWDLYKDCAKECLWALRDCQASYIDGLADNDKELEYISNSVDLLDKMVKECDSIW